MENDAAMTPAELRAKVSSVDIWKMSLGRSASYEKEALDHGVMIFGVDADFYAAVLSGEEDRIRRVGRRIKTDESPNGNSSDNAIATWRGTITNFWTLPRHTDRKSVV